MDTHDSIHPRKLRALIIGYGNPLRGDDALGWRAAECLAAIPEVGNDPSILIETLHQLTPELAVNLADAELVIFIDATAPSERIASGTLRCEELLEEAPAHEALGHHLTPAQTLAYARALFHANPTVFLASVAAASFDYGAPLSPAVEAALPDLVEWTLEKVAPLCAPR